jgi:hypothetical protein
MLRLLLDEHISPEVAAGIHRHYPAATVDSVLEWEDGRLAGLDDVSLLREAIAEHRTLVTYDQATIVPILKNWENQVVYLTRLRR